MTISVSAFKAPLKVHVLKQLEGTKAQYTGEELNNLGLNEAINKPSDVKNINKKLSGITLQ